MAENTPAYDMNTDPAIIDLYLEALLQKESTGNYNAVHKTSTIIDNNTGKPIKVQALGGYGILDINWYGTDTQTAWTKMAGIEGADINDPKAQDAVAKYMVQKYFDRFGSWDLVSIAWFAGDGVAQRLKDTGTINWNVEDSKGTSISQYINEMDKLLSNEMMNIEVPLEEFSIPQIPAHEGRSPGIVGQFGVPPDDVKQHAANILDAMTRANAGGERPRVGLDFEQQAPPQVVNQVSQYAQTIEKAYQEYLDSVNNG
jgi:hypothetical protein